MFAPEFTDNSDRRPSRYGKDAPVKLRRYLEQLFAEYETHLTIIVGAIVIAGDLAYDYVWHELTLRPRNGAELRLTRKRYLELWRKQPSGKWRIVRYIDNEDLPDVVD